MNAALSRFVRSLALLLGLCPFLSGGESTPAGVSEPNGLRGYVQATLRDLAASELKLTMFEDAVVDTVEKHDTPAGIPRYTCWLKNANGKAGYLAVAEATNGFRVVSFSASVANPEPLLRELDSANLVKKTPDFRQIRITEFVDGVPLVPNLPFTLYGVTEQRRVSETALCLSSLFSHLQLNAGIPFFGKHYPTGSQTEFHEIFRKFHGIVLPEPQVFRFIVSADGVAPGSELAQEIMAAEKVTGVSRPSDPNAVTSYYETRARAVMPILRRNLLQTKSPIERMRALLEEESVVWSIGPRLGPNSLGFSGFERALLLDWSYLSGRTTPECLAEEMAIFVHSRGMTARIDVSSPLQISSRKSPFLVFTDKGIAVTCLGSLASGEERFLLVFAPVTGTVSSMTLADYRRQRGFKEIRKEDETRIRMTEFLSRWPEVLQWGVHAVDVRVLSNWHALAVADFATTSEPTTKWRPEWNDER